MRVTVDKQPIDGNLFEEGKPLPLLKHLVEKVEVHLWEEKKIPIALSINGHQLTQDDLEKRQDKPIQKNEELDFTSQGLYAFIAESLDGAIHANTQLMHRMYTFAGDLPKNAKIEVPEGLLGELRHFFEFWTRLYQLLPEEFAEIRFNDKSFDQLFSGIRLRLQESVEAMQKEDLLLASKLLQHELVPAIKSLHEGIPQLRQKMLNKNSSQE